MRSSAARPVVLGPTLDNQKFSCVSVSLTGELTHPVASMKQGYHLSHCPNFQGGRSPLGEPYAYFYVNFLGLYLKPNKILSKFITALNLTRA